MRYGGVTWEVPPPALPCLMEWGAVAPLTQYYTIFFGVLAVLGVLVYSLSWVSCSSKERRDDLEDDASGNKDLGTTGTPEERASLLPEKAPVAKQEASENGNDWGVLMDNARFVLIYIIVLGHVVSIPTLYVPEHMYWLQPVIVWTSMFHMQTFAFLSGLLSKGGNNSPARMGRMLTSLALPYIFSKTAWWMITCQRTAVCEMNLFDTYSNGGLEWYLASLGAWRLMAPLFSPFRPPLAMALGVGLGCIAGYWVNNIQVLAAQRTLSFLPFFLAGYLLDPAAVGRYLAKPQIRLFSGCVLVFSFACFCRFRSEAAALFDLGTVGDLNYDYSAWRIESGGWRWQARQQCGLEYRLTFVHRLARYFTSFILGVCFLAVMPQGTTWFTTAGRRTMYPYLLHAWFVDLVLQPFFQRHASLWYYSVTPNFFPGGWVWGVLGLLSLPLSFFLQSAPVRWVFSPIIEPEWFANLCFRSEAAPTKKNATENEEESKGGRALWLYGLMGAPRRLFVGKKASGEDARSARPLYGSV